jgi:dTDP-4-amino-4,6-dideoxygalactose transaminase
MTAAGIGEVAPSGGLPPCALDLLASGSGPTLEEAICAQLGLPDIDIVSSGTAALLVALTWLRRRSPRRKVIVPAYTCPLVVRAVASAGLVALPCDTVAGGFELDLRHLGRLVDGDTLAVVPTHYGGVLTDAGRVGDTAKARSPDVTIIEDAAQAFGATWQGRSVGLAGDIGVFSFGAGKGFTVYEGGALIAREPDTMAGLRQVATELTSASPLREAHRALLLAGYHAAYNRLGLRAVYGAPKRFWLGRGDEVRAANEDVPGRIVVHRIGRWRKAVGRAALSRLPAHLAASRDRFARIASKLATIPGIKVHLPQAGVQPSATFVFVTLPATTSCGAAIRRLWASQLEPWVLRTDTPNARALAATTLTLSTHRDFDAAAEDGVHAVLRDACAGA